MKKAALLFISTFFVTILVKSQNNSIVAFAKMSEPKKIYVMAKLENGKIYYNGKTEGTAEWSELAKYDNSADILDLDEVAIMKFSLKDSTLNCLSGKYMETPEYKGSDPDEEAIQRSHHQMETTYTYTQGFKLIKSDQLCALAQFCGGQKFIIASKAKTNTNNQTTAFYVIKSPPNYFEEYSYEQINDREPNLLFMIQNSKSVKLDFAVIFFLMKFSQQDTNPCE